MAKFHPGKSGNPLGRPKGVPTRATSIRKQIEDSLPEVIEVVIMMATAGDMVAAKLLMDRALPALRPIEPSAAVDLGNGSLAQQAEAALRAFSDGRIAADATLAIIGAMKGTGELKLNAEVFERLDRVEAQIAENKRAERLQ